MFTLRPSCGRAVTFWQKTGGKNISSNRVGAKPVCFYTTSISASLFPMSAFVSFFSACKQHSILWRNAQPTNKSRIQSIFFRIHFVCVCGLRGAVSYAAFRFLFISNFSINFFLSVAFFATPPCARPYACTDCRRLTILL